MNRTDLEKLGYRFEAPATRHSRWRVTYGLVYVGRTSSANEACELATTHHILTGEKVPEPIDPRQMDLFVGIGVR